MSDADKYLGREQTLIKHQILRGYLERFGHIIGYNWKAITYIDGFSGPWDTVSDNLADSSFSIALKELKTAQQNLAESGKDFTIRCVFVEKAKKSFKRLREFASSVQDAEIRLINDEFEKSIPQVLEFIKHGGDLNFPFVFVDPTGWTGFRMKALAPLLSREPSEVLINFMTGHITRFIESGNVKLNQGFEELFGSADFLKKVEGLQGEDRNEAMVQEYCRNLKKVCGFKFACSAIILDPEKARTHFHLIYATRHPRGIEVFKAVEKKAMESMEIERARVKQQNQSAGGQRSLFPPEEMPESGHYSDLRNRYLTKAKSHLNDTLQSHHKLPYDDAWEMTLSYSLVWESDLKDWIKEWKDTNALEIEGLKPGGRVPKRGEGHRLIWQS